MIDSLFSVLAPHPCVSCGKIGAVLCDYCKNDIIDEPYSGCLVCAMPAGDSGVCIGCAASYQKAWCVSERSGAVESLINVYKFEYVKQASAPLARLIDHRLPQLPVNTVIVPIPTISKHIRQRGYDHIELLCKDLARYRKLVLKKLLVRNSNFVQRGANREQRISQAKSAFSCRQKLPESTPYLLVDDVVTTGATLEAAANALRGAGARTVWVAAVARQTLDSRD